MKKLLIMQLMLILSFPAKTYSQVWEKLSPEAYSFGAGVFTPYPNQVQIDENANKALFNIHPLVSIAGDKRISDSWIFTPQLGITVPKSARDGDNITVWTFYTNFLLRYTKIKRLNLHYGLGWLNTRISGSGGTQSLSNGTATDAFPLPNGSSMAYNLINIFGASYEIRKNWYLTLETFLYNLTDDQSRTTAFTLQIQKSFSMEKKK